MRAILMMARAPRPGAVMTRLEPLLGPDGCARLHAELVRHTTAWALDAADGVWLAYSPADAVLELREIVPEQVAMFAQIEGSLAERTHRAIEEVFDAGGGPLAVIATDAPLLGPSHVEAAWRALARGRDVCIAPTLDGGFSLLALARPLAAVLELPSEAWTCRDGLALMLRALHRGGCAIELLDAAADLDTPADALELCDHVRCPPAISAALHRRLVAA